MRSSERLQAACNRATRMVSNCDMLGPDVRSYSLYLWLAMCLLLVQAGLFPKKSVANLPPPVASPPAPHSKIPVTPFDKEISWAANEYRLDPLLIKAIIAVESEFNPHCVSPKGAAGLM